MHAVPLVVLVEPDQYRLVAAQPAQRRRGVVSIENRITLRPGEASETSDLGEEGLIVGVEGPEPFLGHVVGHVGEVAELVHGDVDARSAGRQDLAGKSEPGRPSLELLGDLGDHVDVRLEAEHHQHLLGLGEVEGEFVGGHVDDAGSEAVAGNRFGAGCERPTRISVECGGRRSMMRSIRSADSSLTM